MINRKRRTFLKNTAKTGLALAASSTLPGIINASSLGIHLKAKKLVPPSDRIRLGAIGMGIMGYSNVNTALQIPGIELAAVCDLYDGRLASSKENFGAKLFTTKDYREIIENKNIDAIVISTSDHWHDRITIDALNNGKAVYCEKPMVHHISEGKAVIDAEQKSGNMLQIGSQRVSSVLYKKAREMYQSGMIGKLVLAETYYDRFSALGAWRYSIPTDASEETVDWERFLGDAPEHKFDPVRFFRWRNYRDYGTGVAGDLFVHLFSGLHVVLDSLGPERIYATGGLRYWDDGRDVPDVMLAIVDYPETKNHSAFNLQIRVNFMAGGGEKSLLKLVGTEGSLTIGWNDITVEKSKLPEAPGYGGWDSYETFTEKQKKEYKAWYEKEYYGKTSTPENGEEVYHTPEGYDDNIAHWTTFVEGIKGKNKIIEDGSFGLRAAGPALATNLSYFDKKVVQWDPVQMKVIN